MPKGISLTLLVMYPYLLKRKYIDGSFNYPISWRHHKIASCTTCLYGKCFQRTLFLQPQGVSLSIADAKVDTFQLLTKSYYNFFSRFFEEKSQSTDLQALHVLGYFNIYDWIDKYMLQNIKKRTVLQWNVYEDKNSGKHRNHLQPQKNIKHHFRSIFWINHPNMY